MLCLEQIQECEILKNYTNFDDIQCCKLSYVKCDESEGHIVSINLRNDIKTEIRNKFSLESFLNQFPSLEKLDISDNKLKGNLIIPHTTLVEFNNNNNNYNNNNNINKFYMYILKIFND
ncbi:hypothetical protein H8356DRAFT_1069970 [Neocallimastix lanati (nom. inval.)]|nr:hypothetical protein H8356DRAFT_1069970 [Neocallimastix sp. JGI-2020a]